MTDTILIGMFVATWSIIMPLYYKIGKIEIKIEAICNYLTSKNNNFQDRKRKRGA